jgi:hypothetical protein
MCGVRKPVDQFHADSSRPSGRFPQCKECRKAYTIEYNDRPDVIERTATRSAEKYQADPEAHKEVSRDNRYQKLYNITIEDYDRILAYQGGVCAICKKPPKTRRHHVDHDHKTGLVRGLVCGYCNMWVLRENMTPEKLRVAADYLEQPPASAALGGPRYGITGRVSTRKRRRKA